MRAYDLEVTGSLKVHGDISAENYIIDNTVVHMTQSLASGSTIFGDTQDDKHEFTGSLNVTGSAKITSLGNATLHVASSAVNNDSYVRITEGPNYFGGFIKYAGNPNILELGVHNANDSNVNNDTTAIQILRENNVGDVIFPIANQKISGSSTSTGSFGSLEISTATNNRARIRPAGGVANKTLILEGANHANASFIALRGPSNGYGAVDFQYGYDQTNSYLSFQQAGVERVRFSGLGKITARSIELDGDANETDGFGVSGSASSTGSFGEVHTEGVKGLAGDYSSVLLVPDTLQFGNDADSMFRRRTSNDVEFRMAGSDIVRINTSGLQVENGNLEVESGNVIASGNISGSATSTGSFGSLVVDDAVQGDTTFRGDIVVPTDASSVSHKIKLTGDSTHEIYSNSYNLIYDANVGHTFDSAGSNSFTGGAGTIEIKHSTSQKYIQPGFSGFNINASHDGGFGFVTVGSTTTYTAIEPVYGDNNTSGLKFNSRTGGTNTERLRITSDGQISGSATSTGSFGSVFGLTGGGKFGGISVGPKNAEDTIRRNSGDLYLQYNAGASSKVRIGHTSKTIIDDTVISGSATSTGSFGVLTIGTGDKYDRFAAHIQGDRGLRINHTGTSWDAQAIRIDSTITTGRGLGIEASSLTTGNALYVYSNSSDTSTDYMALFHQDHASATGRVPLGIKQDANIDGIRIIGTEGKSGILGMWADDGDDNNDRWRFKASTGAQFSLESYAGGSWAPSFLVDQDNTKLHIYENLDLSSGDFDVSGSATSTGSFGAGYIDKKLGIGTTSPTYAVDIHSSTGLQLKNGSNNTVFHIPSSGGYTFGTQTNNHMSMWTNNTERIRILNSGNVGIGTASPSEKLTVTGVISGSGNFHADGHWHLGPGKSIYGYETGNKTYLRKYITLGGDVSNYVASDLDHYYWFNNANTSTPQMSLKTGRASGGELAILTVSGSIITTGANEVVSGSSTSTGSFGKLYINGTPNNKTAILNVEGHAEFADGNIALLGSKNIKNYSHAGTYVSFASALDLSSQAVLSLRSNNSNDNKWYIGLDGSITGSAGNHLSLSSTSTGSFGRVEASAIDATTTITTPDIHVNAGTGVSNGLFLKRTGNSNGLLFVQNAYGNNSVSSIMSLDNSNTGNGTGQRIDFTFSSSPYISITGRKEIDSYGGTAALIIKHDRSHVQPDGIGFARFTMFNVSTALGGATGYTGTGAAAAAPSFFVSTGSIYVETGNVSGSATSTGSFGRVNAITGFFEAGSKISDYVFESSYTLRTLDEVETHISQSKHLPGIPSEANIQEWRNLSMGDRDRLLLEKIEELTLYTIQLNKRIEELEKK